MALLSGYSHGISWFPKETSVAKTPSRTPPPSVDRLVAYEEGRLNEDQTIQLFQELIDSGMVWELQGSYGRMAATLIKVGLCKITEKK